VIVELRGVELHGRHGVLPEEQQQGQPFVYDVELEVGDRGAVDRIEHAVVYRLVGEVIRDVNAQRFDLLEALATALADELMHRFQPSWVRVRVRKPRVRLEGLTLEHSAVTVERP
jgi:dihydroneopterin aldolase